MTFFVLILALLQRSAVHGATYGPVVTTEQDGTAQMCVYDDLVVFVGSCLTLYSLSLGKTEAVACEERWQRAHCVILDNVVHVFGGKLNNVLSRRLFSYDLASKAWASPVVLPRALDDSVIAVGQQSTVFWFGAGTLESVDLEQGTMSPVLVDAQVDAGAGAAMVVVDSTLFLLDAANVLWGYDLVGDAWSRKAQAMAPTGSRTGAALGALLQGLPATVVAFGGSDAGAVPAFTYTDGSDSVVPFEIVDDVPRPSSNAFAFALSKGAFLLLSHGAMGLRSAELDVATACSKAGACVASQVCQNTRVTPFVTCTNTAVTTAPGVPGDSTANAMVLYCLTKDVAALDEPCATASVGLAMKAGDRLGPYGPDDLVKGCEGADWLPRPYMTKTVYVPLAVTEDCAQRAMTMEPGPVPGEFPIMIVAAAAGGSCVLLLCVMFCLCKARRRRDGSQHRGGGGADVPLNEVPESGENHTYAASTFSRDQLALATSGSTYANGATATYGSGPGSASGAGNASNYTSATTAKSSNRSDALRGDFQEKLIERSELRLKGELGRGGYGVVYKGEYRGQDVAVKCINEGLSDKDRADFEDEARILQQVRPHANVVRFLGVAFEGDSIMIVLEFLQGGSLMDHLDSSAKLHRRLIIDWLKDIAAGMIHLKSHGIVHRDLAARNIMLGDDGSAKVTDFGMSRFIDSTASSQHVTKSNTGPLKWMAPESLLSKISGEPSDVWAFGVLMYEVIAREEPYPGLEPVQVAAQVCRDGIALSPPSTFGSDLCTLLADCMQWDAEERPSFQDIHDRLSHMNN